MLPKQDDSQDGEIMKKIVLAGLASGVIALSSAGILNATTIFSDNFEADNTGLNKNNFINWSVTNGTVDLIGIGTDWNWFPAKGKYVDLDGSTFFAGTLASNTSFNPGKYTVTFDLAGSQRGDTNTVTVTLGNWTEVITLGSSAPFATFTQTFTTTGGALSFHNWGGDNIGLLLDNVSVSTAGNPVPESATMLLFGTGIAGLAAVCRRKK